MNDRLSIAILALMYAAACFYLIWIKSFYWALLNAIVGIFLLFVLPRLGQRADESLRRQYSIPYYIPIFHTAHYQKADPDALIEAGVCHVCMQTLTPLGPGQMCLSGHLIHAGCLVYEFDVPARCPLCLHRKN